jgi:hypothetical protein
VRRLNSAPGYGQAQMSAISMAQISGEDMRKLILVAVLAFATLAPVASAETEAPTSQEAVTVKTLAGENCSAVTVTNHSASGTCPLHFAMATNDTWQLVVHTIFSESIMHRCKLEMAGAVNAQGEGWFGLNQITISNPPSGGIDCTGLGAVEKCDMGAAEGVGTGHSENWHFRIVEDHTTGTLWVDLRACFKGTIVNNFGGRAWFEFTTSPNPTQLAGIDHLYRDIEGSSNPNVETSGIWTLETDTRVQVAH